MRRGYGVRMEYGILIAEDEEGLRSLMTEWLNDSYEEGCLQKPICFYEAESVPEAKARIAEAQASGRTIDAAIVDLLLPGGNGTMVIDELLEKSPQTRVLVLSATAKVYKSELVRAYGASLRILEKPVHMSVFESEVKSMLGEA